MNCHEGIQRIVNTYDRVDDERSLPARRARRVSYAFFFFLGR